MVNNREQSLIYITTVPLSLWSFFRGQARSMGMRGLSVYGIASPGTLLGEFARREGAAVFGVPMTREITPLRDLAALFQLIKHLWRIRPLIVHASTPKGGLLGMIAARLTHVPARVYQIQGLPMMTALGWRRQLLRWSEIISCRLAHRVLCVSHKIRDVAIEEGLCPPDKIIVPLGGSVNGVDALERFNPHQSSQAHSLALRSALGIPPSGLVVAFVGRIVRDKGILELAKAWSQLQENFPTLHLVLAGPIEAQDPVPPKALNLLLHDPRVHFLGMVEDVVPVYEAADIVTLPSYREGFGGVLLEAAAMGLPVVATRIPGADEGVLDGVTGKLVPVHDVAMLVEALAAYLMDPELRHQHGCAGRERVLREFRPEMIWDAVFHEYEQLLSSKGLLPIQGIVGSEGDVRW